MEQQITHQQAVEFACDFVRNDLEGYFGDAFVFDPILAEWMIDHVGQEYLWVHIVFDGDQRNLDPEWTSGLTLRLHLELRKLGIDSIPSRHFIKKSEWKSYSRALDRAREKIAAR